MKKLILCLLLALPPLAWADIDNYDISDSDGVYVNDEDSSKSIYDRQDEEERKRESGEVSTSSDSSLTEKNLKLPSNDSSDSDYSHDNDREKSNYDDDNPYGSQNEDDRDNNSYDY